ncbi:hypothetical protein DH2020_032033 [Rehmannia glutinosa]|uniref:Cyclin-D1-binding protein n=1 Tax=Rehmannia glutinosa TaxID=99300 RepID=A0ABR0VGD4_REHGL
MENKHEVWTIHRGIMQMLDQTPASSLEKVSWKEVIQMGEQVSKQATTVGMLYTGENPGVKALEENMTAYFNLLQGFLLLSHGSSIGAGPTLSSCIHKAIKQVVDSSFMLLQEAVSSYGSPNKAQKLSIPQLVGAVWDACSALKKTPPTNVTAIGRAMTQVAVSMKDVLREMKELKPAEEASGEVSTTEAEDKSFDDENSFDGDMGNDLSPEEMKIVQKFDESAISVDSLEKLLKLCQGIGVQVDELGACLYPPQEISAIKKHIPLLRIEVYAS